MAERYACFKTEPFQVTDMERLAQLVRMQNGAEICTKETGEIFVVSKIDSLETDFMQSNGCKLDWLQELQKILPDGIKCIIYDAYIDLLPDEIDIYNCSFIVSNNDIHRLDLTEETHNAFGAMYPIMESSDVRYMPTGKKFMPTNEDHELDETEKIA